MWNQLMIASGGMMLLGLLLGLALRQEPKYPEDEQEHCDEPANGCPACGVRSSCGLAAHR